jgi:hypothetical protein
MKKSVIAAVVVSLGLAAAPFAQANKRSDQAYVESYAGRSDIPVPIAVVAPVVGGEHAGAEVELRFVVDPAGKPVNITTSTLVDRELARVLRAAVAQWRFAPARNAEGTPVARKVVLPMRIADRNAAVQRVAMN